MFIIQLQRLTKSLATQRTQKLTNSSFTAQFAPRSRVRAANDALQNSSESCPVRAANWASRRESRANRSPLLQNPTQLCFSTRYNSYPTANNPISTFNSHIYTTYFDYNAYNSTKLTDRRISIKTPTFPISLKSPKSINNPTDIMKLLAYYRLIRFRPLTSLD